MRICRTCSTTYPDQVGFCPKDGSPLAELQEWVPGATVRGKYRILSTVGQGGMGSVYKALHLGFDEVRALKALNRALTADARFVKRFKQEAFTTRKLQHPNIVRVEDIDETEEGQPFIVMEFIEGKSLRRLIEKHGAMKVASACSMVKQIASALSVAHGLGVVHRDLKPDNIVLVAPEKAQGPATELTVKVLDFGIAKLKEARTEGHGNDSTLTQAGFILGTPEYMSPEQAKGKRGDELDGRSDIYSLGIVMYQMLTGELPFETTTTMEMLMAHLQEKPRPIQSIRPDLQIPAPIADIVMQCLEKSREARPQTAQELIQALERAEVICMNAALAQTTPAEHVTPSGEAAVQDHEQEAARAKEREASREREREAALAREQEGRERQAALARQDEPREKEAALAREREAALARELEAALAQQHEASRAREREAAQAHEQEQREHEAALARQQADAVAGVAAAAQHTAAAGASVMVPIVDGVPAATVVIARQEQPPTFARSAPVEPPFVPAEKKISRWPRTVGWTLALSFVVLVGAIALVRSNRQPAVSSSNVATPITQPQPSPPLVASSPTPVAATPIEPVKVADTEKKTARDKPREPSPKPVAVPTPTADDQARNLELKKKVAELETEGEMHRARGQYDEAIRAYEAGLKLDPTNASLKEKIGYAEKAKKSEKIVLEH